jgi:histidine ammonia-lyase
MAAIILGGDPISLDTVVAVARKDARVEPAPAVRERLVAERAVVERLAHGDAPVYGLNTALGAAVDTRLPPGEIAAFQARALRARSVAVGPTLPRDAVRALMFTRLAGMAAGGSGVSPAVFDAFLTLLNAGVHPIVPAIGSIGAADLALLAPVALALIGEGEVEFKGARMRAAEVLPQLGLAPLTLGPKDALALINSNAGSVGPGALALADARAVVDAIDAAGALSLEGFRGNLSPLDPRASDARPAPGQAHAATRLRALLVGSELWHAGVARRVQDPLCYRCLAPVHGAALSALYRAQRTVEIELKGSGDNPLVLASDGAMISTANFDLTALTLAFEALGIGLAHVARISGERVLKLLDPAFSGLPRFLSPLGPTRTGFASVQKTIAALEGEIRHLAQPASLGVMIAANGVEDHASMAPRVVTKTAEIVQRLRWLAAVELMVAAQAVDLRAAPLGPPLRQVYDVVRKRVPKLEEDRVVGPDIEAIAGLIEQGALTAPADP